MKIFQKIALERIYRLFELADIEFEKHPERSRRYVELAREISKKNKVKIPKELKKMFCKKCGAFLKEGVNCAKYFDGNLVRIVCGECGFSKAFAR
ncbi:MAG: ribonuclease P [Candidatus Diapherotrites archaeon]|nr:ribonuclease P [Candidatus Diapherotrites archaeon]